MNVSRFFMMNFTVVHILLLQKQVFFEHLQDTFCYFNFYCVTRHYGLQTRIVVTVLIDFIKILFWCKTKIEKQKFSQMFSYKFCSQSHTLQKEPIFPSKSGIEFAYEKRVMQWEDYGFFSFLHVEIRINRPLHVHIIVTRASCVQSCQWWIQRANQLWNISRSVSDIN